jgi:hypothetical protein
VGRTILFGQMRLLVDIVNMPYYSGILVGNYCLKNIALARLRSMNINVLPGKQESDPPPLLLVGTIDAQIAIVGKY